jgi:hypothetical protein
MALIQVKASNTSPETQVDVSLSKGQSWIDKVAVKAMEPVKNINPHIETQTHSNHTVPRNQCLRASSTKAMKKTRIKPEEPTKVK